MAGKRNQLKRPRKQRKPQHGHKQRTNKKSSRVLLGVLIAAALVTGLVAFESRSTVGQDPPALYDYQVINVYPHDPEAFTQGLLFKDGFLYESTGLNGRSGVRQVILETGEVVRERAVDSQFFGEGLADWGDTLIQLTWHAGTGFVYDLEAFGIRSTFRYPGEGWGLARHGDHLVMSDGTSELRFLDPVTLSETGRITISEMGRPVVYLNELESVNGEIFANIWLTDQIAIIDPTSGRVTGRIDLSGLLTTLERARGADVLNGIAYDPDAGRLFVTGKLWPKLFEIRLRPR